jgi:hypothetical protein
VSHRFRIIIAVWGSHHIDLFFRIALPSLMTSGNLLGFAPYEAELAVYTRPEDHATVTSHPMLKVLTTFIDVTVWNVLIDEAISSRPDTKYRLMDLMHGLAIDHAAEKDQVMMFLAPDVVFAEGTLAHARSLVQSGKRIVMLPGTRSSRDLADALVKCFNPKRRFAMLVPARDLVAFVNRYPHEQFALRCWGNAKLTEQPSHLYFPVDDEGFIMRGFHHHPIALYPQNWYAKVFGGTVDDMWLTKAVPDEATWHLITDTDDGFVVDINTPAEIPGDAGVEPDDPELHVAKWVEKGTDERQRAFARSNVFVHAGEVTERWYEAAQAADAVIDRILSRPLLPAASHR